MINFGQLNEVIAKVLDLLTDGKADALVRRILCLAWFSADEGVRLAMSEFSGLIITFAISSFYR